MSDFDAKISADNTGYEEIKRKLGSGQMNENGKLFAVVCAMNQLVIGGVSDTSVLIKPLGNPQTI